MVDKLPEGEIHIYLIKYRKYSSATIQENTFVKMFFKLVENNEVNLFSNNKY